MGIFNKKENTVSREAAELEMNDFYKTFHEIDETTQEEEINISKHCMALVSATTKGRVLFDKENETITVTLRKPVVKGNSEINEIVLREINLSELQKMSKSGDEIEGVKYVINKLSGNKLGSSVDEISQKDFIVISQALMLFMEDSIIEEAKKNELKK